MSMLTINRCERSPVETYLLNPRMLIVL